MKNAIKKNAAMLILLNIAKLVFPFITLPYLTRVLSTDGYGIVAYVKAVMSYMQVLVDFGFTLSATKQIVECATDKKAIGEAVGNNITAKLLLAFIGAMALIVMAFTMPILFANRLFLFLSYVPVVLTIFLFDFLFRGLERMEVITIRFVVMKVISTVLTFAIVKADADILWIPILDILGSSVAVLLVLFELRKLDIKIAFQGIKQGVESIKDSAIYFASNVASTTFNVFNTIVLGLLVSPTEVAYWSVCMQVINAVQALYIPISDALYPEMIKTKDVGNIKRVEKVCSPILILGCAVVFVFAKLGLQILGGNKYADATCVLQSLTPTLLFGFYAVLYGWPVLGAIGKQKEATKSTVIAAIIQIALTVTLALTKQMTVVNLAIARSTTEFLFMSIRLHYYKKYQKLLYGLE